MRKVPFGDTKCCGKISPSTILRSQRMKAFPDRTRIILPWNNGFPRGFTNKCSEYVLAGIWGRFVQEQVKSRGNTVPTAPYKGRVPGYRPK